MAEIEEAIHTRLAGFAGLTALISSRNYPVKAPQSQLDSFQPHVVFQEISLAPDEVHFGGGLPAPRFQFNCWAKTFIEARDIRTQVKAALLGFSGTVSGVNIQSITRENQQVRWEEDAKLFRAMVDLRIHWREDC